MTRPALGRNGWINVFVFTALVLSLVFFGSDGAVVMNPEGYGAVIGPIAALGVAGFAGAAFVALRLTAGPGGDVWLLPAIVAPVAGFFGYVLVISGVPAVSLMVTAQPTTVEARVISSGTTLNSSACRIGVLSSSAMSHTVRLEGQPPLTGPICVPSVRRQNASGQVVLSPPPLPDPGPVLIEGAGNWFAVRVEGFEAL